MVALTIVRRAPFLQRQGRKAPPMVSLGLLGVGGALPDGVDSIRGLAGHGGAYGLAVGSGRVEHGPAALAPLDDEPSRVCRRRDLDVRVWNDTTTGMPLPARVGTSLGGVGRFVLEGARSASTYIVGI